MIEIEASYFDSNARNNGDLESEVVRLNWAITLLSYLMI
jgi:hypothetical protein